MFVNFNILNQLGSPAINSNTFANRPAAGQTGRLFVSTDTFEIYRDNGTTWDLIGGPGSSTITGTGTATQVAYFTSSQAIGSSANLYWDNTNTRLGIGTSTPGVRLDIHGTGIMQHINATSATANSLMAFQRTGTNVWRLGDQYNGGSNYFELHNTALANNAIQIDAATNKSILTSIQSYSTGLARGNYLDYTLSLPNGTTFTSPNTVTALGATLNLNIAGSATIPAGARSGADFFNGINFTSAGTFTVNQASTIRAFSNLTSGWAFNGSAIGTITHLAGMRVLFPTNSGTAINVTTNYGLLINDQTANTGTITYTNRWGIYQEGASDLNYMAANLLLGSTVNNGNRLQVTGNGNLTGDMTADAYYLNGMTAGNGALYWNSDRVTLANYNVGGTLEFEVNGGVGVFSIASTGAATFSSSVTASSLIKSGGTSSQYLMADGSTSTLTNPVTGTGTTNYIPKFTSSSAIGNSQIFDNGTSVGINTITPSASYKLDVNGYARASSFYVPSTANGGGFIFDSGGNSGLAIGQSGQVLQYFTGGSERMRLDASGNLGLGVTPSAWANGYKAFEFGNSSTNVSALFSNGVNDFWSVSNAYFDGTTFKYIATGTATAYEQFNGSHKWYQVTSGSAGTNISFTQAMTLTTGGNVLIGTTTDAGQKLQVDGNALIGAGGTISLTSGDIYYVSNAGYGILSANTNRVLSVFNGEIVIGGTIKTAAPSGGTAASWKLGSRVAATVVVNTTEYIEIDIGGTLYKLATVT